jgi:hypothetical protein
MVILLTIENLPDGFDRYAVVRTDSKDVFVQAAVGFQEKYPKGTLKMEKLTGEGKTEEEIERATIEALHKFGIRQG